MFLSSFYCSRAHRDLHSFPTRRSSDLISFFEDDGFHFIGFRQEPLECPVGRTLKRALDLAIRSEEHTSELQSPYDLVCRLLLEKKKRKQTTTVSAHTVHELTTHHAAHS